MLRRYKRGVRQRQVLQKQWEESQQYANSYQKYEEHLQCLKMERALLLKEFVKLKEQYESKETRQRQEQTLMEKMGREAKTVTAALRNALKILEVKEAELLQTQKLLAKTELDCDASKQEIQQKLEENAILDEVVSQKENLLRNKAKEINQLKCKIASLEVEKDNLSKDIQNLKESASIISSATQDKYSAELDKMQRTIQELRREKEFAVEKHIEAENFLRTQEGELSAKFEAELAKANLKYSQAVSDLDDLEATLEDTRAELAQEVKKNKILREVVERYGAHSQSDTDLSDSDDDGSARSDLEDLVEEEEDSQHSTQRANKENVPSLLNEKIVDPQYTGVIRVGAGKQSTGSLSTANVWGSYAAGGPGVSKSHQPFKDISNDVKPAAFGNRGVGTASSKNREIASNLRGSDKPGFLSSFFGR